MQVNPKIAGDAINAFKQNTSDKKNQNLQVEEKSIEQTINDSAVAVKLSMNAQIVLFSMNTSELTEKNTIIQGALSGSEEILEFLSGKTTSSGMSLSNIGYEGKPITELSVDEANELLSDDGFFGIEQTSDRVANFVFSFAGDDLELLEKGRAGVVQGFEEALKMFGGELPEISYKTQERTLSLIDEKINSLKNKE
ncbi:MAG: hydrogenase-4 component G [Arcobacteraceae bacterium]